jgi:hypothetical protein
MNDDVPTLVSKHISPTSVLADLQDQLSDIEEVYVVYKLKDGTWLESVSGDITGIAFAIFCLQHYAYRWVENK